MSSGAITRKEIITDEAIKWGDEYEKTAKKAIEVNEKFVVSIKDMSDALKSIKQSSSENDLTQAILKRNKALSDSEALWKEQIKLENQLISVKARNELATEGTNRALIKERTALSETNKELKKQAREQLGLVSHYEKLNQKRLEAQKRLAELLSVEKQNTAEIARATIEFEKLDARVKAVDAAIKNYSKNIGNYQSAFQGLGGTLRDLTAAFGIATGLALFSTIVKDIFTVIREFDRQLIAVGKTTNISGEALKQFGRDVVDLGAKLDGISIEGLLKSSEIAGQLGVQGTDNILKFSTAIEKLKLTSNIISDEQVGEFAKFIEVSQDSFENADRLASVITQLGNNFATTEREVLSNSTEIQKGIAIYNASAQSVLALGAATSSLGSEAETSRSAIQSTFGVIDNAIVTGKNLDKVLKLTNLSQKELSKQFNKDATGVFVKFIEGLNKAKNEGENLRIILNDLDITEKRAFTVIGTLAAKYEVLQKAVQYANEEYVNNTALNKEVEAAAQSLDSILKDITDKWQEYIHKTNDANNGTTILARGLRFLRDNLKSIIDNIIKYGAVILTFIGVQKTINFLTATWTALKLASTAAQIQFALSTGIGTKAILAEAAALRAATAAQEGLNVATKATPWGLIIGLVSAAVTAYMVFNDTLSETEIRAKAVREAQESINDAQSYYASERDKFYKQDIKQIEDEINLRRAKGENSEKLDKEEIERKKDVVKATINAVEAANQGEIDRTKKAIEESEKRVAQAQKEYDAINVYALKNPFGKSNKDRENELIGLKSELDANKARLKALSESTFSEVEKYNKELEELDKNSKLNNAKAQAELDKKQLAAIRKAAKEFLALINKRNEDAFRLEQFRLERSIYINQQIIDNENEELENRVNAYMEIEQLQKSLADNTLANELRKIALSSEATEGLTKTQIAELEKRAKAEIEEVLRTGEIFKNATNEQKLAYERYQFELTKIAERQEKNRQKIIDEQAKKMLKSLDLDTSKMEISANKEIEAENAKFAKILEISKNNFELIQQATEAHEKKLFNISQKYAKLKLEEQIKVYEKILQEDNIAEEGSKLSAEKRVEHELKLSNFKKELSEINLENLKNEFQGSAEMTEKHNETANKLMLEANERTKQLATDLSYALVDLINSVFDARVSAIEAEMDYWNSYYDEQIELAGNDARQKDLLEKEKAKKQKQLEKERKKELVKAEIFNRAVKLAEIGMNLAVTISEINKAAAAMDFYAAFGFGVAGAAYRAIQIPLAIGTAAIQTGAILATPLPKYKHGRKGGPEEFAVVGDGGVPEIITNPDGSNPRLTPAKPTITRLGKDDIVFKNMHDYKEYLRNSMINNTNKNAEKVFEYQMLFTGDTGMSVEILNELKRNTEVLKKIKPNVTLNNNIDFGYQLWRTSNINWRK